MEQVLQWWRARSSRERMLVTAAAIFAFGVVLPAAAYQGAAAYRADARAALAGAREVEADVARLIELGPPRPQLARDDTSLRGLAQAHAQAEGLVFQRLEPRAGGRIQVVFEPAESLRAYRWIAAMQRDGAIVHSTLMTRIGEGGVTSAEFEVATGP